MATHSYHNNFITTLVVLGDILITEHEQEVGWILWNAYKNRLGVSEFQGISYNVGSLLQTHNLENLNDDFSSDEILSVIKTLPNNNALGPDGFNGFFNKNVGRLSNKTFRDSYITSAVIPWILTTQTLHS